MDVFIESIRVACAPDASDAAKAEGVAACRAILASLEPSPDPRALAEVGASTPPFDAAALVNALRGVNPDQLLDLAIARLSAALPSGAAMPAVSPVRFQLVPIGVFKPERSP